MREISVSAVDEGQRLDKYLTKYMPEAPKSFFYKMMRKKNIVLNGKKAAGMEKLCDGDKIKLFLAEMRINMGKMQMAVQQSQSLSLTLYLRMMTYL